MQVRSILAHRHDRLSDKQPSQKTKQNKTTIIQIHYSGSTVHGVVVRALDFQSEGRGFESHSVRTPLDKLFCPQFSLSTQV